MIFEHPCIRQKPGHYQIPHTVTASACPDMDRTILKEFWHTFTFCESTICIVPSAAHQFRIGTAEQLPLGGAAYAVCVAPCGISIAAADSRSLIHGYMTLLDRIRTADDGRLVIDCCEIYDRPSIPVRMIHYCVFPDIPLWVFERFVRLCGALKYTHIVVEFWGTLKFDAHPALSWPSGFRKDQIRPILHEARDMGIEIVPMLNHWGHASQSRVIHGKHVVLDQAPELHALFSDDGWRWNIRNPKTRRLLRQLRTELIDLCGDGAYFHIGCDEAYGFCYTPCEMDEITDFINEVQTDLDAARRTTIMWADMLLHRPADSQANSYTAAAPTAAAAAYMTDRLSKRIVTADWQYACTRAPIQTALTLQAQGFRTLLCPWDRSPQNGTACVQTAQAHALLGILYTTWDTLTTGTWNVAQIARVCWGGSDDRAMTFYATETAALLRKVYPAHGDYEKSGWAPYDVGGSR